MKFKKGDRVMVLKKSVPSENRRSPKEMRGKKGTVKQLNPADSYRGAIYQVLFNEHDLWWCDEKELQRVPAYVPSKRSRIKTSYNQEAGTFDLSISTEGLKPRRQRILKKLLSGDVKEAMLYCETLDGKCETVHIPRDKVRGTDSLKKKKKGSILRAFKRLYEVSGGAPIPAGKYRQFFGVEIECLFERLPEDCDCEYGGECRCSYDVLMNALSRAKIRNVRLKTDGSLTEDGDHYGAEFVCLTTLEDMSNIEKLCKFINDHGGSIDSTCGLHVHLDCRDGSGRKVANRLERALPFLTRMVPASRLSNEYCGPDRTIDGNRYAKINTASLERYKTVEVRFHSGSTNFKKITNWIKVLHSVARHKKRLPAKFLGSLTSNAQFFGWDASLKRYVKERIEAFKEDHTPFEEVLPRRIVPPIRAIAPPPIEYPEIAGAGVDPMAGVVPRNWTLPLEVHRDLFIRAENLAVQSGESLWTAYWALSNQLDNNGENV